MVRAAPCGACGAPGAWARVRPSPDQGTRTQRESPSASRVRGERRGDGAVIWKARSRGRRWASSPWRPSSPTPVRSTTARSLAALETNATGLEERLERALMGPRGGGGVFGR
jgi:hypothetical protein